jgi:hypothetical protein
MASPVSDRGSVSRSNRSRPKTLRPPKRPVAAVYDRRRSSQLKTLNPQLLQRPVRYAQNMFFKIKAKLCPCLFGFVKNPNPNKAKSTHPKAK